MTELILPEGPLVTPQWVNLYKNHPRLCIVEARMKPVGAQDNWESGFKIPGAVMMDINEDFSEKETDLPHMMPSEEYFSTAAQGIGINDDSVIVLYDQVGTYGSARAWWMFRVMGHERVVVLDGGFPAWRDAGLPGDTATWPDVEPGNFRAILNETLLFKSEDGNLYTAGPGIGSFEVALLVAADAFGREAAELAEFAIEYDPHPPFGTGTVEAVTPQVVNAARNMIGPIIAQYRL